ncbi:hypothetical protein ACO0LM_22655 [Undibacterium sp. Di26W]|uniref:hypothetical protein n=1 Tax=Undibacterium sp. Di26W TaxID=3413035 RepID=UPI003BF0947F
MLNIIQQLGTSITDLSEERINIRQFCQLWRAQTDLLTSLPAQFAEVMENLLGRMEASSLFTEESCSFSQADLTAQLRIWLDKAQRAITRPQK